MVFNLPNINQTKLKNSIKPGLKRFIRDSVDDVLNHRNIDFNKRIIEELRRLGLPIPQNAPNSPDVILGDIYDQYANSPDHKYLHNFVSGNFYGVLILPTHVFNNDKPKLTELLAVNISAIELEDITINAVEKKGVGGSRYLMPASVSMGQTVTVRMYDTRDGDVFNTIFKWHSTIKDYNNGLANIDTYNPYLYKGGLAVAITDNTFKTKRVIYGLLFKGIWPLTLPHSALTYDLKNHDAVEITVQFAFDAIYDLLKLFRGK